MEIRNLVRFNAGFLFTVNGLEVVTKSIAISSEKGKTEKKTPRTCHPIDA